MKTEFLLYTYPHSFQEKFVSVSENIEINYNKFYIIHTLYS
jgi:hypothetical protein